jgi:hypothetical protein
MGAIRELCWGSVPPNQRPSWAAFAGTLLGVWPAPVDHDVCFREAGFSEFADTDEDWDRDWEVIVGRVLAFLQARGTSRLRNGADVRRRRPCRILEWLLPWHVPTEAVAFSPRERLLLSTHDDRFPAAVVEFGDPPAVMVRASDGHPILWLDFAATLNGAEAEASMRSIAEGRPIRRLELRWDCLTGRNTDCFSGD